MLARAVSDDVADELGAPALPRRGWSTAWPALAVALIIVTIATFALGVTKATGGAIPQSDDWSYLKTALLLHRTGELHLQGWGQMFLLGQVYTAQPFLSIFGERIVSLNVYGVTLTALWLWCAFLLSRRLVGSQRAVLLVGVLALWPGLPLLASSFMTDMPAAAASLLTIVLGIRTVERRSRWWLAATLLAGVWAFTIREQFVVCVAAVLVGILTSATLTRRFRAEALIAVVLTAIVCAILEHARHQLPYADPAPFGLHTVHLTTVPSPLLRVPFTIGLDLAPLAVWAMLSLRGRAWLDPGRLAGWAAGVVAFIVVIFGAAPGRRRVVLSNYLTPNGGFVVTSVGAKPEVFAAALWQCTQVIATICGLVVCGEIGAWLRRLLRARSLTRSGDPVGPMLATYAALLAGVAIALSFAGQLQVDRYQLPILLGVGVVLLRVPRRQQARGRVQRLSVAAPIAALAAFLAFLSVHDTIATDKRDAAIWDAATRLTQQGVPPAEINAGINWNGLHAPGPANRKNPDRNAYNGQHWMYLFPSTTDCYVVSISPQHRRWLTLLRVHPEGSGGNTLRIYTYRNEHCRR